MVQSVQSNPVSVLFHFRSKSSFVLEMQETIAKYGTVRCEYKYYNQGILIVSDHKIFPLLPANDFKNHSRHLSKPTSTN